MLLGSLKLPSPVPLLVICGPLLDRYRYPGAAMYCYFWSFLKQIEVHALHTTLRTSRVKESLSRPIQVWGGSQVQNPIIQRLCKATILVQ